jgi:ribosomal protein L11 methyltransferase
VLDYGCGSGILGIVAARLGASEVDAVDVDPQALSAAASNARANAATMRCATPDALPEGQYDLVLANILANPLIVLAPLLAARSRLGTRIALSGILAGQAQDVIAAYAPAFDLRVAGEDEGWVLVEGPRR